MNRLKLALGLAAALLGMNRASYAEEKPAQAGSPIYEVPVAPMSRDAGTTTTLAPYRGDVLLIVNVASKCGFTPQYEGLEALHDKYAPRGLRVLGFPCNDFGSQEPGTEEQIVSFCKSTYSVSFPLFAKVHVLGSEKAPLYRYLTEAPSPVPGDVKWNFEKFLVARDGRIVARFGSRAKPMDKEVVEAVERELGKK